MKSAGSSGSITEDMQNLVNKAKKGSTITIIATIVRNNEMMYVEKKLEVIK
jgi:hypothetical protein